MESKEINSYYSESDENKKEKESHEFNINYILLKIDDILAKKKYSKIVIEILKIERLNKEILYKNENIKYCIYLLEIKILCLCKVIEGKISDAYIYRKNSLVFNSKLDIMKSLEKNFDKLKKILEEDMIKFQKYINDKNIITDNMKEHIILSYARGIYLQGKFCKLKRQISDAASFFNLGINLLKKNINKSIESETYCLYAKFSLALSSILIEDNSFSIAREYIVCGINYFVKALFLTIDNPNGIRIEDITKKIKNNSFISSIKGLIISLFLLGICLEKLDFLEKAFTLYNQSKWIFNKFYKDIDPIFFNIIEKISYRINLFKEEIIREIKNKYIEEKRQEKLRIIEEKNKLKAMMLTNISNRGSFNVEKYLKIENRLKNILSNVENKYGSKDDEGKIYLPIIQYFNFEKNKFDFTFNYLVKEKEKLMENKIKTKNNKRSINNKKVQILKTENNFNKPESKLKLFKTININLSNKNIIRKKINQNLGFNSFDNNINNIKTINKKAFSYKEKLNPKFSGKNNLKLINEDLNSEGIENLETKPDYEKVKSPSNSKKNTCLLKTSFQSSKNINSFKTLKLRGEESIYNSLDKKLFKNLLKKKEKNTLIKEYILNSRKQNKHQKEFLTKNSFVFCKSFKKGIKYLEKMDKREMNFQKQMIYLKDLEKGHNKDLENLNNFRSLISKDKIKEDAKKVYLKIKDKVYDKFKNDNNLDITGNSEKSKEVEKIKIQKLKLENSLIMGLNENKIDEIKKLEKNLEKINQNQFIKMISQEFKNSNKKEKYDEEKIMTEIEEVNKNNNKLVDSLDTEIIKCDQRSMAFKNNKNKFYLPINLKKFKIK